MTALTFDGITYSLTPAHKRGAVTLTATRGDVTERLILDPAVPRERGDVAMTLAIAFGEGVNFADHLRQVSNAAAAPDFFRNFASLAPLPPYPIASLPGAAGGLVRAGAAALGVPADLVAVPLLGLAGAAMGAGWELELKQGFTQRPALWCVVIAPPGSAKSPAQDVARHAFDVVQREAKLAFDVEWAEYEGLLATWQAAKPKDRSTKPTEPRMAHYYTTDPTPEALARILDTSAGVCIVKDEVSQWVASFDQYKGGKGGERQAHLSAWHGAPLKIDRAGKPSIFVEHPVISVVGGIQPDVLPLLVGEAGKRDGFLERFLFSMPAVQPAVWTDSVVAPEVFGDMVKVVRQLRAVHPPEPIQLGREARTVWRAWYDRNAARTGEGVAGGIDAKMPLQVARLALILHALAGPEQAATTPVSVVTLRAAIDLADYHRAHARAVLGLLGTPPTLADTLRAFLTGDPWHTRTDLHAHLGNHATAAEIDAGLALLGDEVETRQADPKNGRPATLLRIANYAKEPPGGGSFFADSLISHDPDGLSPWPDDDSEVF